MTQISYKKMKILSQFNKILLRIQTQFCNNLNNLSNINNNNSNNNNNFNNPLRLVKYLEYYLKQIIWIDLNQSSRISLIKRSH